MYQCAELLNNICQNWVQVGFLGLPDITSDERNLLISSTVGFLVFCWICKQILKSAR